MRTPSWLLTQIAEQGALVQRGATTEAKALEVLVAQVIAEEGQPTLRLILSGWLRKQLRHLKLVPPLTEDGQLALPFPDLPHQVEVSPGRFIEQGFMTRLDWTAARKQAWTKAGNARGHALAIEAAWEKVAALLTDDALTTGEALKNRRPGEAAGS